MSQTRETPSLRKPKKVTLPAAQYTHGRVTSPYSNTFWNGKNLSNLLQSASGQCHCQNWRILCDRDFKPAPVGTGAKGNEHRWRWVPWVLLLFRLWSVAGDIPSAADSVRAIRLKATPSVLKLPKCGRQAGALLQQTRETEQSDPIHAVPPAKENPRHLVGDRGNRHAR